MAYAYFQRPDAHLIHGWDGYTAQSIRNLNAKIPLNQPIGRALVDKTIGIFGRLDQERTFFFRFPSDQVRIANTSYSSVYSDRISIFKGTQQEHYAVVFKYHGKDPVESAFILKEGFTHEKLKAVSGLASGALLISYDKGCYVIVQHLYQLSGIHLSFHIPTGKTEVMSLTEQALLGVSNMENEGFYNPDVKPNNYLVNLSPPEKITLNLSDFGSCLYIPQGEEVDLEFLQDLVSEFGQSPYFPDDFKLQIQAHFNLFNILSPFEKQRFLFFFMTIGSYQVISTLCTSDAETGKTIQKTLKLFDRRSMDHFEETLEKFRKDLVVQIVHQVAASVLGMASSTLMEELMTLRAKGSFTGPQEKDPLGPLRVTSFLNEKGIIDSEFITFFKGLLDVKHPKSNLKETYNSFKTLKSGV